MTRVTFDRGDRGGAHLGVLMDFYAKNQRYGQENRTFSIGSVTSMLGDNDVEDASLCPVRALKQYIRVTRTLRGTRKRLFISCNPEYKADISKNTLALWLRSVIIKAYQDAGKPLPKATNPHEIRALSATMALHCNISMSNILQGCFWQSDSIFTNFYLRDVSVEDVRGFHQFGPLVVAQSVVNRH